MSGTPVLTDLKVQDGNLTVRTFQDVEDIIERNKRLRAEPQKSDWGRHTASIPNNIYLRWLNEEWARGNVSLKPYGKEMAEITARKLRDPDWAYLRTDNPSNPFHVGWQRWATYLGADEGCGK